MYTYICADAFLGGGGGGGGGGGEGAFIYICPPSGGCATTPLLQTSSGSHSGQLWSMEDSCGADSGVTACDQYAEWTLRQTAVE